MTRTLTLILFVAGTMLMAAAADAAPSVSEALTELAIERWQGMGKGAERTCQLDP